jgi:hypothetical protein
MAKITFDAPPGSYLRGHTVDWPVVPRVGEFIDMQDPEGEDPGAASSGVVKSVVWWRDGSCRVVVGVNHEMLLAQLDRDTRDPE